LTNRKIKTSQSIENKIPVINFNWLVDVPDTGRESFIGLVLFGGLVGIWIDVIAFCGIVAGKFGSCTLAWSTNVTWLDRKKIRF
jgi:hypothetical protein